MTIQRILACTMILLSLAASAAKRPTDEALKEFCRNANNALVAIADEAQKQAEFARMAADWEKTYSLQQITPAQVESVFQFGGIAMDKYLRVWLEPILESSAAKQTEMAFLRWKYMPENDGFMHTPKETTALIAFLNANDLDRVISSHADYSQDVFSALSTMKDANWHTDGFPTAVNRLLGCTLSETAAMECVKAFNSIARVDSIETAQRETIRLSCLSQYKSLLAKLDVPRKQKACREQIAYLEGPFACGKLIGAQAPQLHFLRVFHQEGDDVVTCDIPTLESLRGKVVMIDFWGTKCVPCIQSMPEIAELQKHFEGKDVVILGVTSLQGYFADMQNHRTIQCRNNPEKELGCFPPFMKQMGINWHIAISEEDVMNTDYGVLAIPHVTIIDRKGNVRHNAVNASADEKIELINALLAE